MATLGKTLLKYSAGQLALASEVPDWLNKANLSSIDDWQKALEAQGCEHVDKFGTEGEMIDIFRTPGDGYLVEIWDVFRPVAYVIIDQVFDYLRFRIEFLKPLVELSELIDVQDRRNEKSGVR